MPRRKKKYDINSIKVLSEIDHIRHNPGMYIGDIDPTRIFEEVFDNALDEVQAGANFIKVSIKDNGEFTVEDNGRGFPFDPSLPLSQDPPVLSCTKLFSSGKFFKNEKDSPYKIAVGLHGVGLVACYALSDYMILETGNGKIQATYTFENEKINRNFKDYKGPTYTKITVKPSKKYFEVLEYDLDHIYERMRIASTEYGVTFEYYLNDKKEEVSCTVDDILMSMSDGEWIHVEKEENDEKMDLYFRWGEEKKSLSTVNLCKIDSGAHINKFHNVLKKYFSSKSDHFEPNDVLIGLQFYLSLHIVKASFSEQSKRNLTKQSDLKIMDCLEEMISNYFKKYPNELKELITKFENYRMNLKYKDLRTNNGKRGLSQYSKLRDCSDRGGELIICEGESAGGGLIRVRDIKKHAILPLKGVVPNAIKKKDIFENKEMRDIVIACGLMGDGSFKIENLRYDKIIIAADADPAGHFITSLLIAFFAHRFPEIIEHKKLFVCEMPLFGYRDKNGLNPIFNKEDIEKYKDKKILRFKGLGEMEPSDLKDFILDEKKRKLILVKSSKNMDYILDLLSSPERRRELVMED